MNSQESLTEQLADLLSLAHEHGLYDAADWVQRKFEEARVAARDLHPSTERTS